MFSPHHLILIAFSVRGHRYRLVFRGERDVRQHRPDQGRDQDRDGGGVPGPVRGRLCRLHLDPRGFSLPRPGLRPIQLLRDDHGLRGKRTLGNIGTVIQYLTLSSAPVIEECYVYTIH